jgi:hydroxymethylpyrimidine/phosphomethylpyrimidine kinase
MKTALTIAGSDPTGGAGLQADLKVFRAFGLHGLSVVSAITAQNTERVDSISQVKKDFIENQLHTLLADIRPHATKLGMLYSRWAVETVAEMLMKYSLNNLVIDPITVSSSGMSLAENGTIDALREKLLPLSKVITPNIHEAYVITGIMVKNKKDMEDAAIALKKMGPEVVVITGGHLDKIAMDLYYDGEFHIIKGTKIKGEYHGTGCTFSAAIAASLALDYIPLEAVRKAKKFVTSAIKKAYYPGRGMGLLYI